MRVFDKGHGRILFPISEIGVDGGPRCTYCNSFTSVIPMGHTEVSKLHYISFYVHYLNDRVLHSDTGKYTKIKQMLTYYLAGHNSADVPNKARIAFLNQCGVTVRGILIDAYVTTGDTMFIYLFISIFYISRCLGSFKFIVVFVSCVNVVMGVCVCVMSE